MTFTSPAPQPTPRELRQFAMTVGAAFLGLAALAWRNGHHTSAAVPGAIGAALAAAGLLLPTRLKPVYRGWMALALAISKVTTPVFMGVVFFGVLTLLGLVMRLFGRRPLARTRGAATYWVDRPAGARTSDLRRQF